MSESERKQEEAAEAAEAEEHAHQAVEHAAVHVYTLYLHCIYMCVCVYIYIYTYIYIHTYTYMAQDERRRWRRKLSARTAKGQPVMQYQMEHILRKLRRQELGRGPADEREEEPLDLQGEPVPELMTRE